MEMQTNGEVATVQVHFRGWHPDLNGFHMQLSSARVCLSSSDCSTFTVDAGAGLLDTDGYAIRVASSSYCLSILTQLEFQCPLGVLSVSS